MKISDYFKNVVEENIGQEFRLKNIEETRNYFLDGIKQKNWRVKSTKRFLQIYIILSTSKIIGCIFISAFASLIGSPMSYEFCNRIRNLCNNSKN